VPKLSLTFGVFLFYESKSAKNRIKYLIFKQRQKPAFIYGVNYQDYFAPFYFLTNINVQKIAGNMFLVFSFCFVVL